MRIIAGKLGGRRIHNPYGERTHPTSNKIRGALFNALGDIEGLTILDVFSGGGAMAIEAASHGAKHVTAIDVDKKAYLTLKRNIEELGCAGEVKAIRANAGGWSDNNPDEKFDIVLLDPPYDDIRPHLLEKMANHAKSSGIVVLSLPPKNDFSLPSTHYSLLSTKSYGDAQLVFYRKTS